MIVLSIILLLVTLGVQLYLRSFVYQGSRVIFWSSPIILGIYLSYLSYLQYLSWSSSELTKFFLPPYISYDYFLFYVGTRIWSPYIVSFIFALVVLLVLYFINKYFQERFFYKEEIYIISLCVFLVGHPLWIGYIFLVVIIYFLYNLVLFLITR